MIDITQLRYYAQKVLPLVYDDSLSYYELLCKVVYKTNELIANGEEMSGDLDALTTLYSKMNNKLEGLINNLVDVIVPWSSEEEYGIYRIVEYQGSNYIAIQDVPVGIMITNTDYWVEAATATEQLNAISVSVSDIIQKINNAGNKFYNLADYLTPDDATAEGANNSILQNILNEDTPAKIIYVPRGYQFYCGHVIFTKSNMAVCGGGTLHGSWECGQMEYERLFNIVFKDVIFNGDSGDDSAIATNYILKLRFMDNPIIENCEFRNAKYAIYIPEQTSLGFQHFREARINKNTFKNCGYCLFSEEQDTQWNIGDVVVTDNIMFATICHIDLSRVDGITLSNNTFFFPSYDTQPPYKTYNIRIKRCNWSLITQNNIFEAGYCGIYLTNAQNTKITNNNIAWCGQRDQDNGDGIRIDETDTRASIYNIISGNQITSPTGRGIYLNDVYESLVTGNNVGEPSRVPNFYYGDATFVTAKYNAFASSGANILVTNNKTNGGNYEKSTATFNYMNLQSSGVNNGRYARQYTITTTAGEKYATLATDDVIEGAIVIANAAFMSERVVVCMSGYKEIMIFRPDWADFVASRSYTVSVLMNVNGYGY